MLQDNPGWDLEPVNATMDGHKENFQVNLVTRIPVLIVYGTAAVNEENQIRFFDDTYGYDRKGSRRRLSRRLVSEVNHCPD